MVAVFLVAVFLVADFFAADFFAVFLAVAFCAVPFLGDATAASYSASSSSGNFSVSFHGCGTNSRHPMAPTCILLSLDITVMFRPAPWKIGPSG